MSFFYSHSGDNFRDICQPYLIHSFGFHTLLPVPFSGPLQSPPPAFSFPTAGNSNDQLAWGLQWPACLPTPGRGDSHSKTSGGNGPRDSCWTLSRADLQMVLRARRQAAGFIFFRNSMEPEWRCLQSLVNLLRAWLAPGRLFRILMLWGRRQKLLGRERVPLTWTENHFFFFLFWPATSWVSSFPVSLLRNKDSCVFCVPHLCIWAGKRGKGIRNPEWQDQLN